MKKLLVIALTMLVAFYAHARFSFAEPRVTSWLANHSAKARSGDTSACDDYANDMEVTLSAEGRRGTWEVEGGKNEMCGYLKQAAAAFTVLQASTNSEFDQVQIVRDGFPWMSARVKYSEHTTVQTSALPTLTIESENTLVLVRTLSGIKIKTVESRSTGGI